MIPSISGWMDPRGKLYETPGMLKHWVWIENNLEMLEKDYGLTLDANLLQPHVTGGPCSVPHDWSLLLMRNGWIRIFVNDRATEASLQSHNWNPAQLRSIKKYLEGKPLETVYFDYRDDKFGMLRCGTFSWEEFRTMAELAMIAIADEEKAARLEKINEVQERL